MAINASSITTSNTLEQLRQEFNNLVTDVSGLEAGTTTFSAVTATREINTLKCEMHEIKDMLKTLLDRKL